MSLDRMSYRTARYCEGMFAIYMQFSNFMVGDLHQRRSLKFSRWQSFLSLQFYNSYTLVITIAGKHTDTPYFLGLFCMYHYMSWRTHNYFMRYSLHGVVTRYGLKKNTATPQIFLSKSQIRCEMFILRTFWLSRSYPVKPNNLHPGKLTWNHKKITCL